MRAIPDMGELIGFRALQGLGGGGLLVLARQSSATWCRLASAASTRARSAPSSGWPAWRGRCSAASLWTPSAGAGSSTSTCPSASSRSLSSPWCCEPGGQDAAQDRLSRHAAAGRFGHCVILLTTWGGTTYPWGSGVIIGLGVAAVAAAVGWALVERRAPEPVLPLRLFTFPCVLGRLRGRLHRWLRVVRRADFHPAVPAGGAWRLAHLVGRPPASHGAGPAPDLGGEWSAHLQIRSVQGLPHRGYRRHGARTLPAFPA